MSEEHFMATAWNNGGSCSSGAGYGLKIPASDRDRFFDQAWRTVCLFSNGKVLAKEVNVAKRSFWSGTCRELISKDIGRWLRHQGLAKWPKGCPPKFRVTPVGSGCFDVARMEKP